MLYITSPSSTSWLTHPATKHHLVPSHLFLLHQSSGVGGAFHHGLDNKQHDHILPLAMAPPQLYQPWSNAVVQEGGCDHTIMIIDMWMITCTDVYVQLSQNELYHQKLCTPTLMTHYVTSPCNSSTYTTTNYSNY